MESPQKIVNPYLIFNPKKTFVPREQTFHFQ